MGFWDKSLLVFKCLCDHGRQGVRRIAQQTGLSKSSVHRLRHALERRNSHPESWLWETAEGRQWLTRLVVAMLYTFGLKRGLGLDTISAFFARLHGFPRQMPHNTAPDCVKTQFLEHAGFASH